jgi:hypothetical protein
LCFRAAAGAGAVVFNLIFFREAMAEAVCELLFDPARETARKSRARSRRLNTTSI